MTTKTLTPAQIAHLKAEVNGHSPPEPSTPPAAALQASRVDLVALIRQGLPDREFVPGCEPWALRGKRYLWIAGAGTGKSLAGIVSAVGVVEAGGTVAIIDVENGQDEYARRLEAILDARDNDGTLAEQCSRRLAYYQYPALSLAWSPADWADALTDVDLVIFDSSRLALSSVGLAEDANDDYARFVNAFLLPLSKVGKTTLMLDNTGHAETGRARGASSKADLNEVVYAAKVIKPFDSTRTGQLELRRTRTRFADLPERLTMTLGGGTYSAPVAAMTSPDAGDTFRPTGFMERVSRVVEETPGLSANAIEQSVKGVKTDFKRLAIELLIAEGYVRAERDGQARRHHSIRPYRELDDPATSPPRPNLAPTSPQAGYAEPRPLAPSLKGGEGEVTDTGDQTRQTSPLVAADADNRQEGA